MAENRDFKGVWIPKEIWLDKNLGWSEKMLLIEIDSLDKGEGCYAGNEYLGEFFSLSKDRISKMVSSLKEKGYITVRLKYKENSKQIDKRYIKVIKGIGENGVTYGRKSIEGIGEKAYTPIGENSLDNNTSFNNTINNTKDINTLSASQPKSSKQDNIPYAEIIEYLNKATNRSYRNVESNKKLIRFRWKEGYTLTNFFTVIDKKTQEWKNTKMEQYLQPSTLFGSKFDQYLNQEVTNNGAHWTSNGGNTETNTGQININAGFERLAKENAHKFKPIDYSMHDVQ